MKLAKHLHDLLRFASLGQNLNLHQAAQQVGLSQPSLTRLVQRLEEQFRIHLIERGTHGIRLTGAGELIIRQADFIRRNIDQLHHDINARRIGKRGRLDIGFFTPPTSDPIDGAITRIADSTELELNFHEGSVPQLLIWLRRHMLDVALAMGSVDDLTFNTEHIWKENLAVILPHAHPLLLRERVSWPEISKEKILVRRSFGDNWISDSLRERAAQAACALTMVEMRVSRETLPFLVKKGFGITIMMESSAINLQSDGVSYRLLEGKGASVDITAVWLPENANPALRRFLEEVSNDTKNKISEFL
ncbi:LysR family transcriptional regulator [Gluconacetobacter azotocaptans]|uniref:LysR family transcriptional regulator n=1 Tax=Gluconacetobacter azotocaptans TaxID=142834 RepID=A0A7W4PDX8_9PROT|nr:LysR family transcriptional regulator [Gluconacetobacter azotocaptans]MBB2190767.1 LysR family transcriptional regulator [Gluconacetobacter azotocaptans]GBQ30715.1 LysR family transcriptional regulator [Gluconacetobacter azotocaptans DSM 13594]